MPPSEDDNPDLRILDDDQPLSKKLGVVFNILRNRYADLDHISVVVYDKQTDLLKTFLDTRPKDAPLRHYQSKLSESISLNSIVQSGRPRVIGDLSQLKDSNREHTLKIREAGFLSSYTIPMFYKNRFYGFMFFNSKQVEFFSSRVQADLDQFARLLSLIVIFELTSIKTLSAAARSAREFIDKRDCETGAHLDRMARYCRIVALEIGSRFGLTDEFIEHLFLFAPLHDVGKIAIPDSILLKPAALTPEEYALMKTHTSIGLDIVERLLYEFELTEIPYTKMLRNIVLHHHEAVDGSGYPMGLKQDDIPIEARIATTADVFDALTSRRPYKPAWDNAETIAELQRTSGVKLDGNCVDALIRHLDEIEIIQKQFSEDVYG